MNGYFYRTEKVDEAVQWVADRLEVEAEGFLPCYVFTHIYEGGFAGVVLVHNLHPLQYGYQADMTVAAKNPRWLSKNNIKWIYRELFGFLNIIRVQATIAASNYRARKLVDGIGFKFEGVMRRAHDGREDAVLYSILKGECNYN